MRRSRSQQARRRSIFSAQELRQLAYTNETLRNLNRSALSRLKHVRDSYLNTKQYREAAESFEILAIRINSVLQFRDELTTGGRAQKPAVAHVTIGTVCPNCMEPLEEPGNDIPEVLKLDVAQLAAIDCLVELAQHIEERVSARCMSRDNLLKAFGLSRLTRALLRQRRHLLDSAPEQNVKIEVQRDRSGRCIHCNKPVAVDQQQGSRN